jgi:hypothetical protein
VGRKKRETGKEEEEEEEGKKENKNQSIWKLRIRFCSNLILCTLSFEKC